MRHDVEYSSIARCMEQMTVNSNHLELIVAVPALTLGNPQSHSWVREYFQVIICEIEKSAGCMMFLSGCQHRLMVFGRQIHPNQDTISWYLILCAVCQQPE